MFNLLNLYLTWSDIGLLYVSVKQISKNMQQEEQVTRQTNMEIPGNGDFFLKDIFLP